MLRQWGVLFLGLFFLTACGEGFKTYSQADFLSSMFSNPDDKINYQIEQSAGVLDKECSENSDYDACLIWKNPVAQEKTSMDLVGDIDLNLSNISYYGVKLKEIISNGSLTHPNFKVVNVVGDDIQINSDLKTQLENYNLESLTQLMAYYWGQRSLEVLKIRTGLNYFEGANIEVHVNDDVNGWSSITNKIHLGKIEETDVALSGEVIAYYFGLANISLATDNEVNNIPINDKKHVDCYDENLEIMINGCCDNETGCSRAIVSGLAEYQAALVFPDSPVFGESIVNNTEGQVRCSLNRDFMKLMDAEAQEAFMACGELDRGEIYVMGSHLAAKLWQLRNELKETYQQYLLDKIIITTIADLESTDDFKSFFSKLIEKDKEIAGEAITAKLRELANSQEWL